MGRTGHKLQGKGVKGPLRMLPSFESWPVAESL